METWERSVEVEATPSKVFEALVDIEHAKNIMPDIVKVVPLTDGPVAPGFRWKETRRFKVLGFLPLRASAVIEVAEFEKNKRYTTIADDGCNWASYTFTTRSSSAGMTRLKLEAKFKGVGKYAGNERVAHRLATWCEKSDGDLVDRVKGYVEG